MSATPPDQDKISPVQPPVWWLWTASLKRSEAAQFLYGCAAQTVRTPQGGAKHDPLNSRAEHRLQATSGPSPTSNFGPFKR